MSNCAIVGINWGDEGKGRMVDLLTEDYDVVVRYQGGGNAGHTVINEYGKFALHLLPSGIFREGVVNILGNGVALDPENLWLEMQDVMGKGVALTSDNLKISERASLLLPWHRDLDVLEEARLADKKYGSTKQGIAPFYSDKYQKKTVLAGELFYPQELKAHLADLLALFLRFLQKQACVAHIWLNLFASIREPRFKLFHRIGLCPVNLCQGQVLPFKQIGKMRF